MKNIKPNDLNALLSNDFKLVEGKKYKLKLDFPFTAVDDLSEYGYDNTVVKDLLKLLVNHNKFINGQLWLYFKRGTIFTYINSNNGPSNCDTFKVDGLEFDVYIYDAMGPNGDIFPEKASDVFEDASPNVEREIPRISRDYLD